eukprot:1160478-Pelagomonas_calceolata.AAC.5
MKVDRCATLYTYIHQRACRNLNKHVKGERSATQNTKRGMLERKRRAKKSGPAAEEAATRLWALKYQVTGRFKLAANIWAFNKQRKVDLLQKNLQESWALKHLETGRCSRNNGPKMNGRACWNNFTIERHSSLAPVALQALDS